MKYTKEILAPIVERNISMAGVIRDLGMRQSGGTNSHLRRVIDGFELSTSHFKGRGANFGEKHKGPLTKPEEILVLRDEFDWRMQGRRLRKALLEIGRPDVCGYCGQEPMWKGRPLVLTPDHKNGKFWDNRPENLELACPNCHSQTETFAGRKRVCAPLAELADA